MTITIYPGYDDSYMFLHSKDIRFFEKYGRENHTIRTSHVYKELSDMAAWCNNELREEALFEIG